MNEQKTRMSNCTPHGLCSQIPQQFGRVSVIHLEKVVKLKAKF